ncbi:MAG TPA: energy transducer TonB [Thermoanaerobaculia bacterium]|nr:energy transducer TonB [Thermoanaerobaculia bacterium]
MRVRKIRAIRAATILFAFWSVAATCVADSWSLPKTQTVYSKNRQFAVTIIPRQLAGQLEYFQDKVEGRADAGAAAGVANNWPRALFYSVDPKQQLNLAAEFKLVNEVAPVTALVSNDGQYLATFDNWHSRGYGNDAIVIYHTDGSLVRSLSLEDVLTAKDIAVLPRSVSSIQWGAQHSIDEDRHLLVLRIARCTGQDLCLEMPPEVAIHLADGTLVRPARDLLPQLEPTVSVRPGMIPSGQDWRAEPGDPACASQASFSRAPKVPFDSLQLTTTDLALPDFPELARKARVRGSVLLELLVDNGVVACVRTIMGLPLGLTGSARDAALQWRFLPSPDRTGPVRSVVAFDFNLVGVKPEPER